MCLLRPAGGVPDVRHAGPTATRGSLRVTLSYVRPRRGVKSQIAGELVSGTWKGKEQAVRLSAVSSAGRRERQTVG